jgi:hypothetical protein
MQQPPAKSFLCIIFTTKNEEQTSAHRRLIEFTFDILSQFSSVGCGYETVAFTARWKKCTFKEKRNLSFSCVTDDEKRLNADR